MTSIVSADESKTDPSEYIAQVSKKRSQLMGPIRKMLGKHQIPLSEVDAEDIYQSVFIKFIGIVETEPARISNPVTFFAGMLRLSAVNIIRRYKLSRFGCEVRGAHTTRLPRGTVAIGEELGADNEVDRFSEEIFDNEPILNGGVDVFSTEDLVELRDMYRFVFDRLVTCLVIKKDVVHFREDLKVLELRLADTSFAKMQSMLNPDLVTNPLEAERIYRSQYKRGITMIRKVLLAWVNAS